MDQKQHIEVIEIKNCTCIPQCMPRHTELQSKNTVLNIKNDDQALEIDYTISQQSLRQKKTKRKTEQQ